MSYLSKVSVIYPLRSATWLSAGLLFFLSLCATPVKAGDWIYTFRPGDNLWNFTRAYLTSPGLQEKLRKYNKIPVADYVPMGTELRIPVEWLRREPAPAEVLFIRGKSYVMHPSESAPASVAVGDLLKVGDTLVTEEESNVTLRFADGSRLFVQAESQVTLDTLASYKGTGMADTRVRLQQGRVESRVIPFTGAGSRYEITTPAAVTAVRGTDFRLGSSGEPAVTRSSVVEGRTELSGSGAAEVLKAGFGTLAEVGKPPMPPRPLLPAPQLKSLAGRVMAMPYNLQWPILDGAKSYRIRVSPAEQSETVVLESAQQMPQLQLSKLPLGAYVLSVSGVDEVGLQGLPGRHDFTVAPPPSIPELGQWASHGYLRTICWKRIADVNGYLFEVGTDGEFNRTLWYIKLPPEHNCVDFPPAIPGRYFGRVKLLLEGVETSFSDPRELIMSPYDFPSPAGQ